MNTEPMNKVSINSHTSLKNSSSNNTSDSSLNQLPTPLKALMTSRSETSIGFPKDSSPPLKTKDNAVHAGPSPPLEPLKD